MTSLCVDIGFSTGIVFCCIGQNLKTLKLTNNNVFHSDSPSSLPLRESLLVQLFGPPSPSPSAPPSPSPSAPPSPPPSAVSSPSPSPPHSPLSSAPSPVPLRMVVNNRVTKHQIEFPKNHLSIQDICDELKKFRLRLFGKRKFQEPEIRMSKFGVVKSPKDVTLISLKEELIEYKLKSPKARKSPKEIKKIIENNNRIYKRKFNSMYA